MAHGGHSDILEADMANITSPTPSEGTYDGPSYTKAGYYSHCDRCGFKFKTKELTKQRGLLVCKECKDED
jgi:hypothetical protein